MHGFVILLGLLRNLPGVCQGVLPLYFRYFRFDQAAEAHGMYNTYDTVVIVTHRGNLIVQICL